MNIRQELLTEAEKEYKSFSEGILPNVNNILGVRIPKLRKIAKIIAKDDWKTFLNSDPEFMEETLIQGFVIGLLKENNDMIFELIRNFVPKITNWGICDTFCSSLKFTNNNKKEVWNFLQKYSNSTKEYEIRFALVMFLMYFIEEDYLDKIFEILNNFSNEKYYAKMAAAWLISICYVKYQQKTEAFLKSTKIDRETYNKSIQKIIESRQVDKQTKTYLKTLKK